MKSEALYELAEEMWSLQERIENLCPASTIGEEVSCCALKVEALAATSATEDDEGAEEQSGYGSGFEIFTPEEFYDPETGETYAIELPEEDEEAA